MSDPLIEIVEFAGKACGTIAKDLAEVSTPLGEAFRRGWRQAWAHQPESAPEASGTEPAAKPS